MSAYIPQNEKEYIPHYTWKKSNIPDVDGGVSREYEDYSKKREIARRLYPGDVEKQENWIKRQFYLLTPSK